jgi:hypothetical protein
VGEFSTRMVWAGDHWDVALTEVIDGRTRLLATIPLDDWIGLSATQYVLEPRNGSLRFHVRSRIAHFVGHDARFPSAFASPAG